MKICSKCKVEKVEAFFYKSNTVKGGLQSYCKSCVDAGYSARKKENPEKILRYRISAKAAEKKWRDANHERIRAGNLRRNFGISMEQYDEMTLNQGGVCAICEGKCKTGKYLAVDHNHESGKVRGLLCYVCNTSIGKFKDSPELLRRAAGYLEKESLGIGH